MALQPSSLCWVQGGTALRLRCCWAPLLTLTTTLKPWICPNLAQTAVRMPCSNVKLGNRAQVITTESMLVVSLLCRSPWCDNVLPQPLPVTAARPGWGKGDKVRNKKENGENAQAIQQAKLGRSILHCLRHQGLHHSQAVGQERDREAKGHPHHRWAKRFSSPLETPAPTSFWQNSSLCYSMRTNCFVLASKEQI